MTVEPDPHSGEKLYAVTWEDSAEQRSDEIAARNAGEAVWLVHARNKEPEGVQYTVAPLDASEPPRNFTVGHARTQAPFSD